MEINLHNIGEATKQEIFDAVVFHARQQRRKAREAAMEDNSPGACSYLTNDGRKCFVGALISEEEYKEYSIQCINNSGTMMLKDHLAENYNFKLPMFGFLSGLQRIHDQDDVEEWDHGFMRYAEAHQLRYTPQDITVKFVI